MPTSATLTIEGLSTLDAALRELPVAVASDILRDALHAGGKVIRDGIVDKIHSRTGRTVADLRTSVFVEGLAGTAETGGDPDRKAKTGRGHILNYLEFGAKPHAEPKRRKRASRAELSRGLTVKVMNRRGRPMTVGAKIYSKVQHPGIRAQAPMRRTIAEQGIAAVNAFAKTTWQGIVAFLERRQVAA